MADDFDDFDSEPAHTSDGKPRPNSGTELTDAYSVTADELKQFVERREQLESEKKDLAEQVKDLHAELKGRGYDLKAFNRIIAVRKKNADTLREENEITLLYGQALGIDEDLL